MVYGKHIIWTGKDKIMKQTEFCKKKTDYSPYLKNPVNFLIA
jgi:hypothetical protein